MLLVMLTFGSDFDASLLPAIGVLATPFIIGCVAGSHLPGACRRLVRRAVLLLIVVIAVVSLAL